jgi:glycosyltransferase involved in cell wall biosynthesis
LPKSKERRLRPGSKLIDGTEMTVLRINEPSDRKCRGTIAMVTRDNVTAPTAISYLMTDLSFLAPDEYIMRYIVQGNVLVFQRNQCIQMMDGDWILFIDSDMAWQPGAIKTLVETQAKFDLDMVGGLCFQRSEPYQPTLYMEAADENWGYTFLEEWDEDAAVEVDATGMAFVLIHKRVFDRILMENVGEHFLELEERKDHAPQPFFKWTGKLGEDFQFCKEARAAGCHVFVDTSVKVDHLGITSINEKDFLREISFRNDEQQKFREWQLGTIDQKAITRERARERLGVTWG